MIKPENQECYTGNNVHTENEKSRQIAPAFLYSSKLPMGISPFRNIKVSRQKPPFCTFLLP